MCRKSERRRWRRHGKVEECACFKYALFLPYDIRGASYPLYTGCQVQQAHECRKASLCCLCWGERPRPQPHFSVCSEMSNASSSVMRIVQLTFSRRTSGRGRRESTQGSAVSYSPSSTACHVGAWSQIMMRSALHACLAPHYSPVQ